MTQEESNGREGLLTRREMLGATTVLGGMAMIGGGPTAGSAKAQTSTEPRIQLGDDYTIDDDPNGNGDLVITHGPSGNAFTYDSTAGEWTAGSVNVGSADITDLDSRHGYTDESANRALGTWYQNTTGSDLDVSVTVQMDDTGGNTLDASIDVNSSMDANRIERIQRYNTSQFGKGAVSVTVPDQFYYRVVNNGTASESIAHWREQE